MMVLREMRPPSLCCPSASNPTVAMQPHCVQSGLPPYWHGVMRFYMSAERQVEVWEKMHSSGDPGGFR